MLRTGGNIRLVAALAEGLPILYNSPVQEVRHCSTGVAVRTPAQEFRGKEACLHTTTGCCCLGCTVDVGCICAVICSQRLGAHCCGGGMLRMTAQHAGFAVAI